MSKIEIITQPADDEKMSHSESLDSTLEKLKQLVDDNPPTRDDDGDQQPPEPENLEAIPRNPSPSQEFSHESLKQYSTVHPNHSGDDEDQEYDDDGFAIPQGKIPLDGHFSTRELKELLGIAKSEGYLNDTDFKILDHNEKLGDKIVIADHQREPIGKKYGEDDEQKERAD